MAASTTSMPKHRAIMASIALNDVIFKKFVFFHVALFLGYVFCIQGQRVEILVVVIRTHLFSDPVFVTR